MSLGGSEIVDHGEPINNLIEKLKCLEKKGHKGGKRCKSWVQQQSSRGKKKKIHRKILLDNNYPR